MKPMLTDAGKAMAAAVQSLPPGHVLPAKDFISYNADFTSYPSYPVTFGAFPAVSHLKAEPEAITIQVTGTSYLTCKNGQYGEFLAEMADGLALAHERIIAARCQNPKKGTRAAGLAWLHRQVEKLAERSLNAGGTSDGWPDPDDPFAYGDQLIGLRADFAELEAGLYPVPLPEGCTLLPQANFDPFQFGRYYNGSLTEGVMNGSSHD